jgi:CDGSH-type Zn-finger protein
MAASRIADTKPMEVQFDNTQELYWCACGKSLGQPFCDGPHAGSEFTPVAFDAEAGETAALCMCKQTRNPSYCDGSHATRRISSSRCRLVSTTSYSTAVAAAPAQHR